MGKMRNTEGGRKGSRKSVLLRRRAGWSLSGDAWCYEDTDTTTSKSHLGLGPPFVLREPFPVTAAQGVKSFV